MNLVALFVAATIASLPLQRAADVHASVGVNVHIEYTDGAYRDLGRVVADLHYLGVGVLRDAAPNPSNQGQAGYTALAKAGFKFDLFVNGEAVDPAVRRIAALARQAPGSVVSIEGINEVNNHPGFTFAGERDVHRAGTLYQEALYARVKSDFVLSTTPVVGFTDYPFSPGRSDMANGHVYPSGDGAPGTVLTDAARDLRTRIPGQPVVFTELGFPTSKGRPGISEPAQARLLLTSLLQNAAVGVQRAYIYELLDAYPDPNQKDQEKHFGLFNLSGDAKPAARMLRRFMTIYSDASPYARTFPVKDNGVTIATSSPDVRRLVVQKANGEVIAAVWRDLKVYDFKAEADVEIAPIAVDLKFPGAGRVLVIDPVAGTQGEVRRGARNTRLSLGADPLLVRIALDPDLPSGAAVGRE